jgi:hypothetical protein
MKVRTTIQPDREIEVGDAEYRDLQVMGLLVEDSQQTDRSINPASIESGARVSSRTSAAADKEQS